ncbi:MAG TPA: efflux RND transporter periplasmic adaptor subunit [Accumulibacter sp.]|uniref:efflux RND transporter periplasmic adaptor subunit n=2 Tax=Accumulibacter sp. TaxID=2053492 RepID=UPI002878C0B0|nr:efflux RND transporter periplasmic adaptor subunit [Accumulibacter sp.]MDS4055628.1 efflux RND transporter periplasmic adaptor subunit [Accumulibacter sp.]HMV04866.1 efflux RND transporter periplasmic adaptor subunit [Accumulibacter sp.]HMW64028.1 efflux RND transporter periplasmic adaptor subunit [Accumulibacter sp.]HMW80448.1 efflux RND transporter periplasmic adaptor subunit [Accumulibacter sp.]HMX69486.1 efflux RND transporter periplasmic adaptor subunit [Accumulibacter sp.]
MTLTQTPRLSRHLRPCQRGTAQAQWSHHLCTVLCAAPLILLAAGCGKEQAAVAPAPPIVEVVGVVQRDVPLTAEWIASLDGEVNAHIRPQVTGYLISQHYREGDLVRKGQVLFEIDPRTFEAAVEEASGVRAQRLARHQTTRANLARIKPLAEKNAVSQKDLDDATGAEQSARAELAAADAALKTARLNLGFTRISAPITGIAGIAKAQIGDLLSPGMNGELTTVSAVDPIKVYFNISEREYLKVAGGATAASRKAEHVPLELILVDGSTYAHRGRFSLLDRQAEATTGTFKAAALFPNPNRLLRPGQYGRIRATMSVEKDALLVPQRAVNEVQGKHLVAVIGPDNKADVRPVVVGERIGTEWIIRQGLRAGEMVVAEGTQKVRPGSPVTPKPYATSAGPAAGASGQPPAQTASPAAAKKE